MDILIGACVFAAGFFTCFFCVKKPDKPKEIISEIKRVKTSLRNPLKTYEVAYEPYKSKNTQLYQPVKPKRKPAVNEVGTDGL